VLDILGNEIKPRYLWKRPSSCRFRGRRVPRRCYPNFPAQSRPWVEREYGCLGSRKPLVIRVTVTGRWRWAKGAMYKQVSISHPFLSSCLPRSFLHRFAVDLYDNFSSQTFSLMARSDTTTSSTPFSPFSYCSAASEATSDGQFPGNPTHPPP
jgi:hypothetical protein